MGRGRGRGARGRDLKNPPGRPPVDLLADRLGTISFPVTPIDEEIVTCAECGLSCKFREFRLHNMAVHYNIAKTTEDSSPQDHKFFTRKLLEMGRLAKITTFFCPRKPCEAFYKSALGLAFHLDGCGKTAEEVAASLIECDLCHKKYSAANMTWHKKTAHPPQVFLPYPVENGEGCQFSGKRKSAMKALEFMKEITDIKVEADDQGHFTNRVFEDERDEDFSVARHLLKTEPIENDDERDDVEMIDDENLEVTPSIDFILGSEEVKVPLPSASIKQRGPGASRPDFTSQASKYLDSHPQGASSDPWDTPSRELEDPLDQVILKINSLQPVPSSDIRQYLPLHEKSIHFNTRTKMKAKDLDPFHRLSWFEGQVEKETDFISFAGGPITAIAWHPSGNYLALSTLRQISETPNLLERSSRSSSIQIYCRTAVEVDSPVFSLRLVLATDFGYVNYLQWSTFSPQLDTPDAEYVGPEDNKYRLGYLCAAFEDSTCRIFTLKQNDFELRPTFSSEVNFGKDLPVYTKVPEIILSIEDEVKTSAGQCICFDWDEISRFLVSGYSSGHVAVFNVLTTSPLSRKATQIEDAKKLISVVTYLTPIWLITAHFSPITAIVIDPKSSRYFYTGSMDRTLRSWDLDLRQEMECKKVGCVIDMCWIRGWIHLGVAVDAAVSNPCSQYNFLRFYSLANTQSRPNNLEYFNISSTKFSEGMVLSGCDHGRVSVSYYDAFWRECDYDRNKKKRNVINVGSITIDQSTFESIPNAKTVAEIALFPEDEEPRLTLNFCRERVQGSQEPEPSKDDVENILRFYKYVRVNKVCWAPDGKHITIGYRNGLFAIIRADFEKIFT